MEKLPKDVFMRVKTNENDEFISTTFKTTTKILPTISKIDTTQSFSQSTINELTELVSEIKEVKKQGAYILGKRDLYIDVLKRFDECKSVPDLYKIIDEMRNELKKIV